MKVLIVVVLVVLAAGAVVLGIYMQRENPLENLSPQEIEFTLREMRRNEATATTTEAIERRLRLATAIAQEGNRIKIADCFADPLVLKVKKKDEIVFDNPEPQQLILSVGGHYYTVIGNGTLTLKADFNVENNDNLIRYICGQGGGAPTFHGFILPE